MDAEARTLTSRDGTPIACWSSGAGPSLLLIHGAMQDHTRWSEISPPLEERFTVYTFDRRGRGESGDGPDYSMHHECEDAVAVVEQIGGPVTVLGHSYGAGIALEAALMTDRIDRLVLYEPGILEGVSGFYDGERVAASLAKAERQIQAGDNEKGIVTLLREVIEVPDSDIDLIKSMPSWPSRVAAAHTVARELRAEGSWMFDPARYANLVIPVLLLSGSESYQIARDGTAALHKALPNSRVVEMEGQGHAAMTTAPELFVREVLTFLAGV